MNKFIIFQEGSMTIRQMPQNYLIAHHSVNGWVCAPDLAADRALCNKVFNALFEYSNKYGSGQNLIKAVEKA